MNRYVIVFSASEMRYGRSGRGEGYKILPNLTIINIKIYYSNVKVIDWMLTI